MYNLKKFRKKKHYLYKLMPFAKIISPGIVVNKDGSMMATFVYRGPDLASAIVEYLGIITVQLNSIFSGLDTNWVLYMESQRRESIAYAEDTFFPDKITQAIDDERRKYFSSGDINFENKFYFTLYWMPPSDTEGKLKSLFFGESTKKNTNANENVKSYIERCNQIFMSIKDLQLPDIYWLNKDELATYLYSMVSVNAHKIKLPDNPIMLDKLLYSSMLIGGKDTKLANEHIRIVSPLNLTKISRFGMFDGLNQKNFEYRWVTRFCCLNKQDSLSELNNPARKWRMKEKPIAQMMREFATGPDPNAKLNPNALEKGDEISLAKKDVESDECRYGYYSTVIVVKDKNRDRVEKKAEEVVQFFKDQGIDAKVEDINAIEAFLSSVPGNLHNNCRRSLVSTGNLVHLMPFTEVWSGPERNEHFNGPPLLYTQTIGSTQFRLDLHIKDVGHTIMVGMTGAGKSVHLNILAAQFRKYKNANVFIFDKGASSKILTYAVGGEFYDLANEENGDLSFQPLANIEDDQERAWCAGWLYDFICRENHDFNPDKIKKYLWQGLESMLVFPKAQRTMTVFCNGVQNETIKNALRPMTLGNEFGNMFDSDKDNLHFSKWQVFEMQRLLSNKSKDNDSLVSATLMYIFHRIEQRLEKNSNPTYISLDECWVFFKNPEFVAKIAEWLRVLRKYNAFVVFATQSLVDIVDSPIFSVVLENCPTRIFLPNKDAITEQSRAVYEMFGLNSQQTRIIADALPQKDYYYVSPKGSRLYDLVLGPKALSYCAVNKVDQIVCDKIIRKYGKENFNKEWEKYIEYKNKMQ